MIPAPDERPGCYSAAGVPCPGQNGRSSPPSEKKESKKQKLAFTDFIHARHNRSETIAAFLALLELLRLKQISIQQDGAFSPIYITERKETAHGDIETGTA